MRSIRYRVGTRKWKHQHNKKKVVKTETSVVQTETTENEETN